MKKIVQGLAGFNALFQALLGVACIVAPVGAAGLFHVEASGPTTLALVRMFGGLLAASGAVSAWVALDPDRDRAFLRLFGGALLVNVAADCAVIGAGELRFDQLAAGMLIELALAVLLFVYGARAVSPARAV